MIPNAPHVPRTSPSAPSKYEHVTELQTSLFSVVLLVCTITSQEEAAAWGPQPGSRRGPSDPGGGGGGKGEGGGEGQGHMTKLWHSPGFVPWLNV